MELTHNAEKHLEQVPHQLQSEFPQLPASAIELDVREHVRDLIADAHFDDYVPLLVHKAVREHLRGQAGNASS